MKTNPVDVNVVLGTLKDFQQRTAKFAFERLVLDPAGTRRFLVADEVGLGKTLVARGVVAQTIDHLWGRARIDIIYVCSNKDIARQNINRLKVTKDEGFALATRLTLLARRKKSRTGATDFRDNALNFISLTPGTSFDPQGTQLGEKSERALLLHLLQACWGASGMAPQNVLQGNAGPDSFRAEVAAFPDYYDLDPEVLATFKVELGRAEERAKSLGKSSLRARFEDLCSRFPRMKGNIPARDRTDRNAFVGELRMLLARACVRVLSPDLVILDEFQRFRHLLAEDTEAGMLAHELFNFADHESKAHVLLLSATPYKMYTIAEEAADDNHYIDFLKTLRFLFNDSEKVAEVSRLFDAFRQELVREAGHATSELLALQGAIQRDLTRVIVRTERLAASLDRNGMLTEVSGSDTTESQDLLSYCDMQRVARVIGAPDVLEYWKSAPYLLNFLDDYQLKDEVVKALNDPQQSLALRKILGAAPHLLLSQAAVAAGKAIPSHSPRLRGLLRDMTESGAWRLLWVPPTCPYYELQDAFAAPTMKGFTKRLVFSSWRVVPKVIASLVSYDAERHARAAFESKLGRTPPEATEGGQSLLLRFSRERDRPHTGLPIFTLIYPSLFFAEHCDPLACAIGVMESGRSMQTLDSARSRAAQVIATAIAPFLAAAGTTGPKDESWYWAAPLLLDLARDSKATRAWLQQGALPSTWAGEQADDDPDSAWVDHVAHLRKFAEQPWSLGPPPEDLLHVLSTVAIAGPANCALRALARAAVGQEVRTSDELRNAAAAVGWAFRGHFNRPHVITIVRGGGSSESYWQTAIEYCASGCLQAVLDEYAHVLRESLGLIQAGGVDVATKMAAAMASALGLRPSNLKVDFLTPNDQLHTVDRTPGRMTARFALPLVEAQEEAEQDASRVEKVREAFNSPFWPFVVASTSIGQEGLDFHTYCHAVVHWNLPSNPVDMEQREGRVHRYKGHAIRKNVAAAYANEPFEVGSDPWAHMFARAVQDRASDQNDLVPFWVYPLANGAHVERHVYTAPLSRDRERLEAIRRTMAVYRMVFGQPRQDDLVQYLLERNHNATDAELQELTLALNIDLSPPAG